MWSKSQVRQCIASLAASLSVTMSGAMFVWMAPLMVKLTSPGSPLPMTKEDTSWLNAIIEISEAFTTIPAGLLADRWGRKPVMLASGPLLILSWVIVLTTRSLTALCVVKLIQGVVISVPFIVTPMYLAEIAEPKLRGTFCGNFQVFWYIGSVYSYTVGPLLDYQTYTYLECLLPILFIVSFAFVPESPYYLLMVNKEQEAKKALSWLRNDQCTDVEFNEMKEAVEEDMKNRGSWRDLFSTRAHRHAFAVVQAVTIIKFLSGMSSICLYSTQTFAESGQIGLTADQMTLTIGLILIVTTLSVNIVADRVGRKPLLLISTAGGIIFHSIIAVYYYLERKTMIDVSSYLWVPFTALIAFCIITNVGLGPVSMTVQAEYFSSNTRGIGGGVTGIVSSVMMFLSIRQYQLVDDYLGVYMNYVIFAAVSLIGTVIFPFLIRETAGKSLGQIQKSFAEENKHGGE